MKQLIEIVAILTIFIGALLFFGAVGGLIDVYLSMDLSGDYPHIHDWQFAWAIKDILFAFIAEILIAIGNIILWAIKQIYK